MHLDDLPHDLFYSVAAHLIQSDTKTLRLVCKTIKSQCRLRSKRAFISPSRANIDAFQGIVSHEKCKNDVQEIIWDDARFTPFYEGDDPNETEWDDEREDESVRPRYFQDFVKDAAVRVPNHWEKKYARHKIALWKGLPEITVEESFHLYRRSYQDQQAIIASGEDVDTLRLGLTSLPNLTCVTLSSEAWRLPPLYPYYETPLFRSLPPGIQMPLPWPCLGESMIEELSIAQLERLNDPWEDFCSNWRGYTIVLSELLATAPHHRVNEFLIDVDREMTGISCQLFMSRNVDYDRIL